MVLHGELLVAYHCLMLVMMKLVLISDSYRSVSEKMMMTLFEDLIEYEVVLMLL